MENPIEARQVPEVRQSLLDDLKKLGLDRWLRFTRSRTALPNEDPMIPRQRPSSTVELRVAEALQQQELNHIESAELFFVTGLMTQLAVHAGASLPSFRLQHEDLPAPHGFIVWAEPIGYAIPELADEPIVAAVWGTEGDQVWASFYYDFTESRRHAEISAHGRAYLAAYRQLNGMGGSVQ